MMKKEVSNLQEIMKKKAAIGLQNEILHNVMIYLLYQDYSIEEMLEIIKKIPKEVLPTLEKNKSFFEASLSLFKKDFPSLDMTKPLGEDFKRQVVNQYMMEHPETMFGEKQYNEFTDFINTLIKK